jgi:hypothetical protein
MRSLPLGLLFSERVRIQERIEKLEQARCKWLCATKNFSAANDEIIFNMSCLPKSGGCEKEYTDPFIAHLNEVMGTAYIYRDCLDITDSASPQPETLYEDLARRHQLVIERKSISWPSDYPHRHSNDHFVANLFSHELQMPQLNDDLYEVGLPLLIHGTEKELRPFVMAAAETIRSEWPKVEAGLALRVRVSDRWWWGFRRVPGWDKKDGEPKKGLKFSWSGRPITQLSGDFVDPHSLPEALVTSLNKIFLSCVKKFRNYSHAERVLILDPHGDLRYLGVDWWRDVFSHYAPPAEIGEIWSGVFDWVDDYSQGWMFERLR